MMKLLMAGVLALFASAATAGVYAEENRLYVTGNTTQIQMFQVAQALASNDIDVVILSGNGGDMYSGLGIGRLIRNAGVRTQILSGTSCVSACAFAALGGTDVWVGGSLFFHRPYLMAVPAGQTLDDVVQSSEVVGADVLVYLNSLGYGLMFGRDILANTSPCRFYVIRSTSHLREIRDGARSYLPENMC